MTQPQSTGNGDAAHASPSWRDRLSLLSDRDFRRIWLVGAVYGTTRWLETLAIAVFVFQLTRSPFLVAVMLMARMLPLIFFGSITGALAEQFNRRALLFGGLVIMTALSATLGTLALTGRIELWHIGVGAFLSGMVWSTDLPVRRTLLGDIAGLPRLGVAMSLDAATNNATRALGPAIGGALFELIGLHGAYLFGCALYATAGALALTLRYNPAPLVARGWGVFATIVVGLRYIRSQRVIVAVLTITVVMNFFAFPFASMVPVIGDEVLHLSAFPIGVLMSAEGTGAFLGALVVALFARPSSYRRIYFYGSLSFMVAVLLFSLSTTFSLALTILFLGGLCVSGFTTMQSTIMFTTAPPEVRSRVLGVLAVCIGAGPLGLLHIGILADWLGAPTAVAIIAVEGFVAMIISFFIWRELR